MNRYLAQLIWQSIETKPVNNLFSKQNRDNKKSIISSIEREISNQKDFQQVLSAMIEQSNILGTKQNLESQITASKKPNASQKQKSKI